MLRAIIIGALLFAAPAVATAQVGLLQSCEAVITPQGPRWLGSYCGNYDCSVMIRRYFVDYCPPSVGF